MLYVTDSWLGDLVLFAVRQVLLPCKCFKFFSDYLQVRGAFDEGEMWKVIDQNMGSYPSEVMDPFITLAMSCVDNDTNARPTMKEVTRSLESLLVSMQGKPGLTDMMSMDTTKSDFSVQLKEDMSPSLDTGFDTGSSQTSKITNTPESTANFMSAHGKSPVQPR